MSNIATLEVVLTGYKKVRKVKTSEDFIEVKFLLHPNDAHEVFAHIPLGEILEIAVSLTSANGGAPVASADSSAGREAEHG